MPYWVIIMVTLCQSLCCLTITRLPHSVTHALNCIPTCYSYLYLHHTPVHIIYITSETYYHKSPWWNSNIDPDNKLIMVILMAMGDKWRWNQNLVMIISARQKITAVFIMTWKQIFFWSGLTFLVTSPLRIRGTRPFYPGFLSKLSASLVSLITMGY